MWRGVNYPDIGKTLIAADHKTNYFDQGTGMSVNLGMRTVAPCIYAWRRPAPCRR